MGAEQRPCLGTDKVGSVEELQALAKKIPKELKDEADTLGLGDPDWLAGMLAQVRPMLQRRLMRRGAAE